MLPGAPLLLSAALWRLRHSLIPEVAVQVGRGRSAVRLRPGLLRPPPVAGRRGSADTITLLRTAEGGEVGWAELILRQDDWFTPALATRAAAVLDQLRDSRAGGTWWGAAPAIPVAGRTVVVASADRALTGRMLDAAVAEAGAARTILLAPHAATWSRSCRHRGIALLAGVVDPWPLLDDAAGFFAEGRSELALLAAMLGRAVRPFTPGPLSLTQDPARLAAAVLLLGARYADPFTGERVECEAFLALASFWRRRHVGDIACCVGISFWKRRRIAAMLGGGRVPAFRKTAAAAVDAARRRGGGIAVWPSRAPAGLDARAAAAGVPVARVEDGFIRSVGLGADFLPPLSLVLDRLGLYYDATGPSELERILSEAEFPPALLARAAALRFRTVQGGVTKYNTSGAVTVAAPPGRRVVLVPGQVADDRSVLLGGAGVRPGLDLLARVRARMPEAWIIYKPHPDVEAGHRDGALPDAAVLRFADQVLRGGSMAALLAAVEAVHTLTSLTGFEALLRGVAVTTYGQPFYAGWGLTDDANPPPRRVRRLPLDALVAGTLISYPYYVDPVTLLPCGPEIVLHRLADPALRSVSLLVAARRLQGRAFASIRRLAWSGWLAWRPIRVRNPVR